jgi:hypothetical protein
MVQVWRSDELEEYNAYVLGEQTVRPWMRLSLLRVGSSFDHSCRLTQVVSAGALGVCSPDWPPFYMPSFAPAAGVMPLQVFGRNGWYCLEADVERLPSLAGWRGLREATAIELFNATLYVYSRDWGPNAEIMRFLQLPYEVVELGVLAAEAFLESRLKAGLPTLFFLWTPHIFHAKYKLNRIHLPEFSKQAFSEGRSDYPTEVSATLLTFARYTWHGFKTMMGSLEGAGKDCISKAGRTCGARPRAL